MSDIQILLNEARSTIKEHGHIVDKLEQSARDAAALDALTRNSFPLRPSSSMKSERDLFYGLQAHYVPGSVVIDPVRNPILLSLGHVIEGHLVGHLEKAFTITHRNQRVDYGFIRDVTTGAVITLSGELDFCITNPATGEVVLCDSKSSGEYAFTKTPLPKEDHIAQLHCYLRSPWARALGITRAFLFYYNKNNSNVKVFEFTYNPALADAIVAKFQRIHDIYRSGALPPREHVYGLDWQASYSSFLTHDTKEFHEPLEARDEVFNEGYTAQFEKASDKDIIRYIATVYGNKVVNGYYLEVGSKGLLLKQSNKRSKKHGNKAA